MSGAVANAEDTTAAALRRVVVAAETRLLGGHDSGCRYLDDLEDDQGADDVTCDCGHADLAAAVVAIRASGVLG